MKQGIKKWAIILGVVVLSGCGTANPNLSKSEAKIFLLSALDEIMALEKYECLVNANTYEEYETDETVTLTGTMKKQFDLEEEKYYDDSVLCFEFATVTEEVGFLNTMQRFSYVDGYAYEDSVTEIWEIEEVSAYKNEQTFAYFMNHSLNYVSLSEWLWEYILMLEEGNIVKASRLDEIITIELKCFYPFSNSKEGGLLGKTEVTIENDIITKISIDVSGNLTILGIDVHGYVEHLLEIEISTNPIFDFSYIAEIDFD